MKDRNIQTFHTTWRDIAISISFDPVGYSTARMAVAHIEVRSLNPESEPLPITDTGYRSHFCGPEDIEDAGGPVAYVTAWLDDEARSPRWKAAVAARRQLTLF